MCSALGHGSGEETYCMGQMFLAREIHLACVPRVNHSVKLLPHAPSNPSPTVWLDTEPRIPSSPSVITHPPHVLWCFHTPMMALHMLIRGEKADFWWCDRQEVNYVGVVCLQESSWFILMEELLTWLCLSPVLSLKSRYSHVLSIQCQQETFTMVSQDHRAVLLWTPEDQ